jgi:hypothetical protein
VTNDREKLLYLAANVDALRRQSDAKWDWPALPLVKRSEYTFLQHMDRLLSLVDRTNVAALYGAHDELSRLVHERLQTLRAYDYAHAPMRFTSHAHALSGFASMGPALAPTVAASPPVALDADALRQVQLPSSCDSESRFTANHAHGDLPALAHELRRGASPIIASSSSPLCTVAPPPLSPIHAPEPMEPLPPSMPAMPMAGAIASSSPAAAAAAATDAQLAPAPCSPSLSSSDEDTFDLLFRVTPDETHRTPAYSPSSPVFDLPTASMAGDAVYSPPPSPRTHAMAEAPWDDALTDAAPTITALINQGVMHTLQRMVAGGAVGPTATARHANTARAWLFPPLPSHSSTTLRTAEKNRHTKPGKPQRHDRGPASAPAGSAATTRASRAVASGVARSSANSGGGRGSGQSQGTTREREHRTARGHSDEPAPQRLSKRHRPGLAPPSADDERRLTGDASTMASHAVFNR